MSLSAGSYTLNDSFPVYDITLRNKLGMYYGGTVLKVKSSRLINGVEYAALENGQSKGFEPSSRSGPKSPVDGYIRASVLTKSGTTASANTPTYTNSNFQITISTRKIFYYYHDTTAKQYPEESPPQTYTVRKTYVAKNGVTWGCVNTTNNKWLPIYASGGKTMTGITIGGASSSSKTSSSSTSTSTQVYNNLSAADTNPTMGSVEQYIDGDYELYNVDDVVNTVNSLKDRVINSSVESLQALANMASVIGIPPKITEAADPKYMTGLSPSNDFGRIYANMFMMNSCVFSIQPCKVKYLPGFSSKAKESFLNAVAGAINNYGEDANLVDTANEMGLSGQLFEATSDYVRYMNTVNLLARVTAIFMGIGDETVPGTTMAFKNADYSYYKRFNAAGTSGATGLWGSIQDGFKVAYNALVTRAINDDTYTHFYMTADGTAMSDSMSVTTTASSIEGLFNNGLSELGRDLQFLFGSSLKDTFWSDIGDQVSGFASNLIGAVPGVGPALSGLLTSGVNYLKGGRLVFPQMLDDCTYDRSYTGTCRFISPSGAPIARFMNCMLPLCYLLPYVLPQMLSENMYTYPFVCKVDVPGQVHCDLACMTNLRIQRGGQEGQSWTVDGSPFEIDVSFDITPLYSKLMVTNTLHPILFLTNTALTEYLGAMCGISFTGDQLQMKLSLAEALLRPDIVVKNNVGSLFRGVVEHNPLSDAARWLFTF